MILTYLLLVVTALASVAADPFETLSRRRHHKHKRVRLQVGREELQDPNDPQYMKLAEESYEKYAKTHLDSTIRYSITLKRVTRQLVQGYIYRLKFNVFRTHLENYSDKVTCKSKVWDKGDYQKETTIRCHSHKEVRRQGAGGEELQDPDDPKYKELAKEAYDMYHVIYMDDTIVKNIIVTKVTRQVVQGFLYRLTFKVLRTSLMNFNEEIVCNAKVWDKIDSQKEFTVDCDKNKALSRKQEQEIIPGGELSQDPNNPKYKKLAHESLEKYREAHNGIPNDVTDIRVSKVTMQVVSGVITRIDFTVLSADAGDMRCHSVVWEQPWINMKDFTVDCNKNKALSRMQEQEIIAGGQLSQDPTDPKYKKLAHESLEKYREAHNGIPNDVTDIRVSKVTTQVVSGVITRIDFTVLSADAGDMRCHSVVWEQPWINMKDFTVDCNKNKALSRMQEQEIIAGGQLSQDPTDPKYKKLAHESLEKYREAHHGIPNNVKDITVSKVTTQVVSGVITRIDFDVLAADMHAGDMRCHSAVWQQPWKNMKDFTVNCEILLKREGLGVEVEEDPNDPEYQELAQESYDKYLDNNPAMIPKELTVTRATYQEVAGSIKRIDFVVVTVYNVKLTCHSSVLEQPWLNKKDITVNCDSHGRSLK